MSAWISVKDAQPDADIAVLAYTRRGYRIVVYDGYRWHGYNDPYTILLDVTHWQDLPEEPQTVEDPINE